MEESPIRTRIPRPFFVLMLSAGLSLLLVVLPLLLPLLTGGVLALLFRPVFLWFQRRFRGRKGPAAGVTLLAFLLVFVVPASFLGYFLLQDAQTVVKQVG